MPAFAEPVESVSCGVCGASVDSADARALDKIECPHCGATLTVPGVVGNLLLTDVLGRGANGMVYRAFDQSAQRHVAVKVFFKKSAERDSRTIDHIDKCLAEARALGALHHPNIVRIYQVAQKDSHPFIAMELLEGDRLDKVIAEKWLVEESRALRMAIDVAEGLKAVHDAGFAHLDVKPDNIQMDRTGRCKLLDYETALTLQQIAANGAGLVGTPYYVAPEIIRQEAVDFRADMYSLGATLFHLIAQRPPFQGETARDVVQGRLKRKATNLSELRDDVSPATAAVIARMLEPDPADRHDSFDALLTDLRAARTIADAAGDDDEKPGGNRVVIGAAVGAVLLLLVGGGIALLGGGKNDRPNRPRLSIDNGEGDGDRERAANRDGARDDRTAKGTRDAGERKDETLNDRTDKDGGDNNDGKADGEPVGPKDGAKDGGATKDGGEPSGNDKADNGNDSPPDLAPPDRPDPPVVVDPPDPPNVNDEPDTRGWLAGPNVTLLADKDFLAVGGTVGASEPVTIRRPNVPGPGRTREPVFLALRLKALGEGDARIWWNTEAQPLWDESRSRSFTLRHDDEWHDYIVPLHAAGERLELRLDLGVGPGLYEIQHIRLYPSGDAHAEPAAAWNFAAGDGS